LAPRCLEEMKERVNWGVKKRENCCRVKSCRGCDILKKDVGREKFGMRGKNRRMERRINGGKGKRDAKGGEMEKDTEK